MIPPRRHALPASCLQASGIYLTLTFTIPGRGIPASGFPHPPMAIRKPEGDWVGGYGAPPLLPGRRVLRQTDCHMTVTFWEASSAEREEASAAFSDSPPACFQHLDLPLNTANFGVTSRSKPLLLSPCLPGWPYGVRVLRISVLLIVIRESQLQNAVQLRSQKRLWRSKDELLSCSLIPKCEYSRQWWSAPGGSWAG